MCTNKSLEMRGKKVLIGWRNEKIEKIRCGVDAASNFCKAAKLYWKGMHGHQNIT
jgi:hypothetical protein